MNLTIIKWSNYTEGGEKESNFGEEGFDTMRKANELYTVTLKLGNLWFTWGVDQGFFNNLMYILERASK